MIIIIQRHAHDDAIVCFNTHTRVRQNNDDVYMIFKTMFNYYRTPLDKTLAAAHDFLFFFYTKVDDIRLYVRALF